MRVDVMEINEGNKLIAEFMDMEIHNSDGEDLWVKTDIHNGLFEITNACFHFSWDWLMPVVEKIKKCGYDDKGFGALKKIDHWLVMVQINELWLACIHFINWYNSNPTR